MKFIKGFLLAVASLLLCGGISLYALHQATVTISSDVILSELVDQMSKVAFHQVNQLTSFLPESIQAKVNEEMLEELPQATKEKVEEVKKAIAQDPKLLALAQTYLDALLDGATQENPQLPDAKQDMKDLASSYVPELAQAAGIEITSQQIDIITDKITERVDLNSMMEQAIDTLHGALTPSQIQLISTLRMVQSTGLFYGALAMIACALVLIVLCTKSATKWLVYAGGCLLICGLGLLVSESIVMVLISDKIQVLQDLAASLVSDIFSSISQMGMQFTMISIGCFVVYLMIQFLKNHLLSE